MSASSHEAAAGGGKVLMAAPGKRRFLSQSRQSSIRGRLERLIAQAEAASYLDLPVDAYGDGIVHALETRTAQLLGKPQAVFFPSGVMAQQAALRIWARRSGRPTIGVHGLAHTQLRELGALETVAGLRTAELTSAPRPLVAEDVARAEDSLAAVVLELPLRDAGFRLPDWEQLEAVIGAIRAHGAAVHFDGARLWECPTHFGRGLADIAAPADSVYVSFYKSLGGLSGAALLGDEDFATEARRWRRQYGGLIFQQFPIALGALTGLANELPRLPAYVAKARMVAEGLERVFREQLGECLVTPRPPHTHQFQLHLPFAPEILEATGAWQAETGNIVLFGRWRAAGPSGWAMTEVTIADSAMTWTQEEADGAAIAFAERLRDSA